MPPGNSLNSSPALNMWPTYSINTGYIANRASAYDTDAMKAYVAEVPQALATRDALQYAGAELATQNLGQVRGIFHDYLQRAINGEMGAAEAMAAAQAEADSRPGRFLPLDVCRHDNNLNTISTWEWSCSSVVTPIFPRGVRS